MPGLDDLESVQRIFAWGHTGSHEQIGELPTYVDEQGRTIKVCPTRWAKGIGPQGASVRPRRGAKRSTD